MKVVIIISSLLICIYQMLCYKLNNYNYKRKFDTNSSLLSRINSFIEDKIDCVDLYQIQSPITFTVDGEPIALARHRVAKGIMYDPSSKQKKIFSKACSLYLPTQPLRGPLRADLIFYFKRPLSHYRTGKFSHILKDNSAKWHTQKRDLDNLVKFVLDSLNGLAYDDDSQICVITSAKLYTENNPRTFVKISPLFENAVENIDRPLDSLNQLY